jgi:hypothetical protein
VARIHPFEEAGWDFEGPPTIFRNGCQKAIPAI